MTDTFQTTKIEVRTEKILAFFGPNLFDEPWVIWTGKLGY
jgi:hypothetical protein